MNRVKKKILSNRSNYLFQVTEIYIEEKKKESKATHLALKHVDLPVLNVHMILELGELGVHTIPLLLRLHRGLRLFLDHPVLLLEPLPHFLHLHARNHAQAGSSYLVR